MRRRRPSIGVLLLRGIGLAALSGIAAVMLLSPRTRHRALDVAKDGYGKVNEKLGRLRSKVTHRRVDEVPAPNGLAPDYGTSTDL